MFEFESVELMNWAYWPTVKMPLDQGTIMITGPNGSGKTTFLDALRTLLRAPRLSSNRRFTDYLVGNVETAAVRAVVTNTINQYRDSRPFEHKGFTNDKVTLAVLLRRKSGRWERRFAILEGDVGLEELRQMKQSELVTPSSYTHDINEAGFSEAFLKVLALEQGQTDKLCEKSPRELLDLLLDVHGDKEIIDRYKRARENYQTANLEIQQLAARLAEEQARLMTTKRAADEFKRYRKLRGQYRELKNQLIPQAEYREAQQQIQQARLAIEELNMELKPVDREVLNIEDALEHADTDIQARKNAVLNAREDREALEKEERELDFKLNNLVQERKQLQEILDRAESTDREDPEALRERLDESRRQAVRLELQQEQWKDRMDEAERDLWQVMNAESKIYPRYVSNFVGALNQAGIEHVLLCDIVDILDADWQLAVESIMGRDRFTVIVDSSDQLAARRLGEQQRYRCYIASRSSGNQRRGNVHPNAAIHQVQFLEDGVPDWIVSNLERTVLVESVQDGMDLGRDIISVTRQGYRQDRRGGIAIAVDHYYCGSLGQSSRQSEIEQEIKEARSRLDSLRSQRDKVVEEQGELVRRLRAQEALGEVDDAEERIAELNEQVTETNDKHKQALQLRREAEEKLISALDELHEFERDIAEKRRILDSRREAQSEQLEEIKDLQNQIKRHEREMIRIEDDLGRDLLTDKALRDVPDLDELTPQYYAVENLLAEFEEPPEETAIEVYEHHKSQYDHQREVYEEHEQGLRNWENEYRLAREKYLSVVAHTIREYRKNVLHLADLAGVNARVELPDLTAYADILDQAELNVAFGFDGKLPSAMGGSQLSGGQRVVASLILLMSLATRGGVNRGGFFIIDEPFAHLSLERIGDVSNFLEKTRCQFILTSPTTHNTNVFTAARLQLNFRIKPPEAEFAPLPTIIRR